MARKTRYGEPWEEHKDVYSGAPGIRATKNGTTYWIASGLGFVVDKELRHAITCVNTCAGLTNKELKRGVVAKK